MAVSFRRLRSAPTCKCLLLRLILLAAVRVQCSRGWNVGVATRQARNSESNVPTHKKDPPIIHSLLAFGFGLACCTACLPPANAAAEMYHWDLLNGSVDLSENTELTYRDRATGMDRHISLRKPQIVGAGGGGAVFAFDQEPQSSASSNSAPYPERDVLLKISWEGTAKTVQRECSTLQLLEDRQVQAAERCLGAFPYPGDKTSAATNARTMILVAPYMRDAVASVSEVDNEGARMVAVDQIVRTLVQMLAANIITIDVQPLISKSTGQTIFIDMTEAQVLQSSQRTTDEYSFLDKTLISSFVSEMVALIPENYWKVAQKFMIDDLSQRKAGGNEVSERVRTVLTEQTPFLVDER